VTDGDAHFGKSPLSPLLKSFPKVVSSVSSVTIGWLRGLVELVRRHDGWTSPLQVALQPAGLVLAGSYLPPVARLDTPNTITHLPPGNGSTADAGGSQLRPVVRLALNPRASGAQRCEVGQPVKAQQRPLMPSIHAEMQSFPRRILRSRAPSCAFASAAQNRQTPLPTRRSRWGHRYTS
jgi:hypothetical protein